MLGYLWHCSFPEAKNDAQAGPPVACLSQGGFACWMGSCTSCCPSCDHAPTELSLAAVGRRGSVGTVLWHGKGWSCSLQVWICFHESLSWHQAVGLWRATLCRNHVIQKWEQELVAFEVDQSAKEASSYVWANKLDFKRQQSEQQHLWPLTNLDFTGTLNPCVTQTLMKFVANRKIKYKRGRFLHMLVCLFCMSDSGCL